MAETLADFVADELLAFRKRVLAADPQFFAFPENQTAYQSFVQALPYVWVGRQQGSRLLPLGGPGSVVQ